MVNNSDKFNVFLSDKTISNFLKITYKLLHIEIHKLSKNNCFLMFVFKYYLRKFGVYKKSIEQYINKINLIQKQLKEDMVFAYESDPACSDLSEISATYPGYFALFCYRISHMFYENNNKIIARIISEFAHLKTGIDINPGAEIDSPFFIDHGTGIVIGETTKIGKYVKVYQGVTLGAISLVNAEDLRGIKRHPTIEDNVTIYANASILGGNTKIGHNSTIGIGVIIKDNIESNSTVFIKQEIVLK